MSSPQCSIRPIGLKRVLGFFLSKILSRYCHWAAAIFKSISKSQDQHHTGGGGETASKEWGGGGEVKFCCALATCSYFLPAIFIHSCVHIKSCCHCTIPNQKTIHSAVYSISKKWVGEGSWKSPPLQFRQVLIS